MKWRSFGAVFTLGLAVCLTWFLTPVQANADDACTGGVADTCYGDGSDGNVTIAPGTVLTRDMNYRDLTVPAGVTLDTAGYTVRVCDTLTNEGTITDNQSGGDGGTGGLGGRGQDPCGGQGGPAWPEDGECGDTGDAATCPAGGSGGDGGGGGGGGGGARWNLITCYDANGGDGHRGGNGGRGGGCVRIHAFNLNNQGLIHADGQPGSPGSAGSNGEYFMWGVPQKDHAGGGGGGGAGGNGGNGGTVEIHYADLESQGSLRANGGPSPTGGAGGLSGTTVHGRPLDYGALLGSHYCGGIGCPPLPAHPRGGDGGCGQHFRNEEAEDGGAGDNGLPGLPGQTQLTQTDPTEACCIFEEDETWTCRMVDWLCCEEELSGTRMDPGSECLGDANTDGSDDLCQGIQACCSSNGVCTDFVLPADCVAGGGTPQGPGPTCGPLEPCCLSNGDCVTVDPLCCDDLGGVPYEDYSTCGGVEAYCLPGGECVMADALCCANELGGTPQGDGTVCTQEQACCKLDGTCEMLDPLCCNDEGGFIPEGPPTDCEPDPCPQACCMSETNTCFDRLPDVCEGEGGNAMGPGTACTEPQACCQSNGLCTVLDPLCCEEDIEPPGEPQGPGSTCLGDRNGDGVDDACEPRIIPTVSEWGLIVMGLLVLGAGVTVLARRRSSTTTA